MNSGQLSTSLSENLQTLKSILPLDTSFDFMTASLSLGNIPAYFLGVNGFCKTDILQQIMADLQDIFADPNNMTNLEDLVNSKIAYAQVKLTNSIEELVNNVLCGPSALLLDGFEQAILLDVRSYPTRSINEPDLEKVTRGARDGFVETLLMNANLIRRRIRSSSLVFSIFSVGMESKTDVAVGYIQGKANPKLIRMISDALTKLNVTSLTMGTKSLEELLVPKKWLHPLPCMQLTERPDVACSYLSEGHILLLIDNSPSVLILPCSIFQFTQNPEDYYSSPLVGTYFRMIRFLCIPVSLLFMPLFMLLTMNYQDISMKAHLLSEPAEPYTIFIYVLVVEFLLDLFKYSSALSSGKYSGSLSIVGGLIIGDIAVSLNWASVEVLFYGAFTLLASMSISSREFSNALRIYRLFLVLTTGLASLAGAGLIGFILGLVLVLISFGTTPTFGGYSYFWPLFPFNWKALSRLLFRNPTPSAQPVEIWSRGNPQK